MPILLIADDHPLFRAALRGAAAEAVADMHVEEADTFDGVIAVLDARSDIDLVLLDLHMPGNHGLAGLAAIRAQFPAVAVALVSANEDPQVIRRALDHGAAGYIPKSAGLDEMRQAIRSVLACEQWLPPALRGPVERADSLPHDADLAARLASLTPQQFRVLTLVAQGLLNKQIADRLDVQERTVKAHLSAIFEKLGVRNRTHAGVILRELEIGDPARRVEPDVADRADESRTGTSPTQ
ncbi:response regulator [Luteimonas salinilitoris]|uniref:Response regulator n=1 Tax=Luteimonas salinilitoris TaxID=3237697 RepID=A0ABV4HT30_9GAMM